MTFATPLTKTDNAKKAAFAAELLRSPDDPYSAARRIFPFESEKGKCIFIAANWPSDSEVKEAQKRLIEENGPEAYLPNKIEFAALLWKRAQDDKVPSKDQAKFAELFGQAMGFITKGSAGSGAAGGGSSPEEPELPLEPTYKVVTE